MSEEFDLELERAIATLDETHAGILTMMTGAYSAEERDTWTMKEVAARGLLAGTASDAELLMLTTEANIVEQDVTEMCNEIIGHGDSYRYVVGVASGIRRKTKRALNAVDTVPALAAILAAADDEAGAVIAQIKASM